MTGDMSADRTHESIINGALARVLRERVGLNAVAETLRGLTWMSGLCVMCLDLDRMRLLPSLD